MYNAEVEMIETSGGLNRLAGRLFEMIADMPQHGHFAFLSLPNVVAGRSGH